MSLRKLLISFGLARFSAACLTFSSPLPQCGSAKPSHHHRCGEPNRRLTGGREGARSGARRTISATLLLLLRQLSRRRRHIGEDRTPRGAQAHCIGKVPQNAVPQSGDVYLRFNGTDAYVEVPSITDYSVSTTGALTVSAWMRPNTLNFPHVEPKSDYIHWLGKGDASGHDGNQEWTFRMYNHVDHFDTPPRPNRISFYLFNPQGGLGVGSYVQVPVIPGQWIHLVAVADSARTYLYRDGQFIRCDTYRGPAMGGCEIHPSLTRTRNCNSSSTRRLDPLHCVWGPRISAAFSRAALPA